MVVVVAAAVVVVLQLVLVLAVGIVAVQFRLLAWQWRRQHGKYLRGCGGVGGTRARGRGGGAGRVAGGGGGGSSILLVLATVANVANLCTSSFIFAEQRGPLLLPLSAASVSATDIDSTAAPPALPANVVGAAAAAAAAAATLGFGEVGGSGGCSNPASNNVNCTGRPIVLSGWC